VTIDVWLPGVHTPKAQVLHHLCAGFCFVTCMWYLTCGPVIDVYMTVHGFLLPGFTGNYHVCCSSAGHVLWVWVADDETQPCGHSVTPGGDASLPCRCPTVQAGHSLQEPPAAHTMPCSACTQDHLFTSLCLASQAGPGFADHDVRTHCNACKQETFLALFALCRMLVSACRLCQALLTLARPKPPTAMRASRMEW
jgi:hypothetical protein